jgi:hypothetical protein
MFCLSCSSDTTNRSPSSSVEDDMCFDNLELRLFDNNTSIFTTLEVDKVSEILIKSNKVTIKFKYVNNNWCATYKQKENL